jgi:glycosyltransferase involved in cell wall biosynthesis
MKILFLSHSSLITGGAERCLLEYSEALIQEGHECHIVLPLDGDLATELKSKKIPFSIIKYLWPVKWNVGKNLNTTLRHNGIGLIQLYKEIQRVNPDVIITNTIVIPWGFYLGRALGIPNVLLIHEIINDKNKILSLYPDLKTYLNAINENVDYIIYNSESTKKEYDEVFTKPKVAKGLLYPVPPITSEIIEENYIPNKIGKVLKMVAIGSIHDGKNQIEIARAVKELKDRGIENVSLSLYGDFSPHDSYMEDLSKFIKDNNLSKQIHIHHFTDKIYRKINEHNVVISASRMEAFGRTIVEGQFFGRIVIASQAGGGAELVEDGKTGFNYKLGNPKELADRIEWILNNKKEAEKVALNAKELQYKKFMTSDRLSPLFDAVKQLENQKIPTEQLVFNPLYAMLVDAVEVRKVHKVIYMKFKSYTYEKPRALLGRIYRKIKTMGRKSSKDDTR